jgi:hypothetical protein
MWLSVCFKGYKFRFMPTKKKLYMYYSLWRIYSCAIYTGERLSLQPILNSNLVKCLEACLVAKQLWKMGVFFLSVLCFISCAQVCN